MVSQMIKSVWGSTLFYQLTNTETESNKFAIRHRFPEKEACMN